MDLRGKSWMGRRWETRQSLSTSALVLAELNVHLARSFHAVFQNESQ